VQNDHRKCIDLYLDFKEVKHLLVSVAITIYCNINELFFTLLCKEMNYFSLIYLLAEDNSLSFFLGEILALIGKIKR